MTASFILDAGGYTAKAGFSHQAEPRIIPNCIMKAKHERRRAFIGSQVNECRDASGLFYLLPFQRGYLVNWDLQKTVWDYMFGKECFSVGFPNTTVLLTEPYFNFSSIQEGLAEIFFEEYEAHSMYRCNTGYLSNFQYCSEHSSALCCLVVDSGYSFTHVAPYCKGQKVTQAIRRIDVGGKILTNHLKEIISYRQLHVMDETYVVNQCKEDACYVALDFYKESKMAAEKSNNIATNYILPDFTNIKRGYLKNDAEKPDDNEQVVRMNNERYSIPEILFHPSDVHIYHMGIPETIIDSISSCPEYMQPHLYKNILLTGGCAKFRGFKERVYKEVRAMAPDNMEVRVELPDDPVTYAWYGGVKLCQTDDFSKHIVTKRQYEDKGFASFLHKADI